MRYPTVAIRLDWIVAALSDGPGLCEMKNPAEAAVEAADLVEKK